MTGLELNITLLLGNVNKAFHAAEEGKSKSATAAQTSSSKPGGSKDKWVSNYVPYGDYPSGGSATSSSEEQSAPEQSATANGGADAAWKKNYVAYEEKADDDAENKDKE